MTFSRGRSPLAGPTRTPPSDTVLCFERFRFDCDNEELWLDERRISLKPRALMVLRYLLEHPDRLITKRELLDVLWEGVHVGDAVLKSHLRDIREALGDDAKTPRFIETAHRRGYRFIAAVREEPARRAAKGERSVADAGLSAGTERKGTENVVGRGPELSCLEACLGVALEGRLQAIFITGGPGAGKTTLARVFVERLHARGGFWIGRGQCIEQYGAGEAYLPLLEVLERLCRGTDHARILAVLRRSAPSWLAHVSPSSGPEQEARATSGSIRPERMLREMAEAIFALGAEQPLVLVLEDLQWADYSTLQLISYLVRRGDPARLMLIGTYRPHDVAQRSPDFGDMLRDLGRNGCCRELALLELDVQSLSEYLAHRFPAHRFPAALVGLLREKTGGNPLFVGRIVDFWQERGGLALAETWQLGVELSELARIVPQSLTRALEAELDRLPDLDRSVLEAASIVGTEFSVMAVAAALEMDVLTVEERCAAWTRRGQFLHAVGHSEWPDGSVALRCAFNHGLYRQVVQDAIPGAKLSQLHRRVAARLAAGYAAEPAAIAAEISMHLERSQQWAEAVRALLVAAETALSRGAWREAADQLAHGLGLALRLPPGPLRVQLELQLQMMRAAILVMTLGYSAPEVVQVYARARELCATLGNRPGELLPVLGGIWRFHLVRGDVRTSNELSAQALSLAGEQVDADLRLEAEAMVAVDCCFSARFGEARGRLEALLPALEARGDTSPLVPHVEDTRVLVLSHLSWALWFLGYPDRALSRADEAVAAAERLQQPFTRVFSLYYRCVLLQYRRDNVALLAATEQVQELAARHGFSLFGVMATMLRGGAIAALGDVTNGLATFERGWDAFSRSGAGIAGPSWRSLWAELLAAASRVDPARRLLDAALAVAQANQDHVWDPELYRLQGELARHAAPGRSSSAESAEALLERAIRLARERGAAALELRASTSLARLWRDQGRREDAERLLSASLEPFEEGGQTTDLLESRRLLRELGGAAELRTPGSAA